MSYPFRSLILHPSTSLVSKLYNQYIYFRYRDIFWYMRTIYSFILVPKVLLFIGSTTLGTDSTSIYIVSVQTFQPIFLDMGTDSGMRTVAGPAASRWSSSMRSDTSSCQGSCVITLMILKMSRYLSIYLSVCLSVCLCVCLSVYKSVCLSVCLCACQSVC